MTPKASSQTSSKLPVTIGASRIYGDSPTTYAPPILLEAELYRQFREICRKRDTTVSQIVRSFIRETVETAQQDAA